MSEAIVRRGPRKDMSGEEHGCLTVIGFVGWEENGDSIWSCECKCGKIVNANRARLKRDTSHLKGCSSGCLYILAEHFWERVKKVGNCWEWQGGKHKKGYGKLESNGKSIQVHRLSYRMHCGEVPDDLMVCHECDNPCCVRPDHLFLGTALQNNRDRVNKGRSARGENSGASTMTGEQARAIVARHLATGDSHRRIAADMNLGRGAVYSVIKRKSWIIETGDLFNHHGGTEVSSGQVG